MNVDGRLPESLLNEQSNSFSLGGNSLGSDPSVRLRRVILLFKLQSITKNSRAHRKDRDYQTYYVELAER